MRKFNYCFVFVALILTGCQGDIGAVENPHSNTPLPGKDFFNINVYLENSKSMDGYVKGVTEFETAIYNLLGDFKISGFCDSLNLSYINKSIPYQKRNALAADIQDFIEKLEPSTFKLRGGERGSSDLKNILGTVLKTVNERNAAVLISDFVFSPGKNENAQNYLNNQGVGIKIDFSEKLKKFDLSAVVIQLQSNFDGLYYDKVNRPIPMRNKRPYYIWILGNTNQVSAILKSGIVDNIKGGYLNRFVLQSIKAVRKPNYKILYSPKVGSFSARNLNNKIISNAAVATDNKNKGLFGFSVAVDFSNEMQDANYFLDTSNYVLNDSKYGIKVTTNLDKSDIALTGFTHVLALKTNELKEENLLKIDLIGKMPGWIYTSTSVDDSNILNDKNEQQKTFGFKYLVEGVSDAFYPKTGANINSSIYITIKK